LGVGVLISPSGAFRTWRILERELVPSSDRVVRIDGENV